MCCRGARDGRCLASNDPLSLAKAGRLLAFLPARDDGATSAMMRRLLDAQWTAAQGADAIIYHARV